MYRNDGQQATKTQTTQRLMTSAQLLFIYVVYNMLQNLPTDIVPKPRCITGYSQEVYSYLRKLSMTWYLLTASIHMASLAPLYYASDLQDHITVNCNTIVHILGLTRFFFFFLRDVKGDWTIFEKFCFRLNSIHYVKIDLYKKKKKYKNSNRQWRDHLFLLSIYSFYCCHL